MGSPRIRFRNGLLESDDGRGAESDPHKSTIFAIWIVEDATYRIRLLCRSAAPSGENKLQGTQAAFANPGFVLVHQPVLRW